MSSRILFWFIFATLVLVSDGELLTKLNSRVLRTPLLITLDPPQKQHEFYSLSTIYASPNGSLDSSSCGSVSNPCNLGVATNISSNNAKIILEDGIYQGVCPMVLRVSVSITAQNTGNAIIDCQQNGAQAFIVGPDIEASFTGITIQNALSQFGSGICSPWTGIISVDSCSFINNTAYNTNGGSVGAAILAYNQINITNSVFINNSAVAPTPTSDASGGALYIVIKSFPNSEINIINSLFYENSVLGGVDNVPYQASECGYGDGGAVVIGATVDYVSVNIQDCNFIENFVIGGNCAHGIITGQASAGALDLAIATSNFSAVIDSTDFTGNFVTAGSGGNIGSYSFGGAVVYGVAGVSSCRDNSLSITNSNFNGNSVNGGNNYLSLVSYGGAIVIADAQNLLIENSTFSNNAVNGGGGTVTAGEVQGGALILQNTDKDMTFVMTDSIFSDNMAAAGSTDSGTPGDATGGAIYLNGAQASNIIQFTNVEFSRNFAIGGSTLSKAVGGSAFSGAINLIGNPAENYVFMTNCTFDSNNAIGGNGVLGGTSQGGSGFIAYVTQITFSNCFFLYNTALGGSGSDVVNTAYGGQAYGGALCLTDAPTVIQNSKFTGNEATGGKGAASQTAWDLQGQDGGSGGNAYGGSIYSTQGNTVNIISTEFSENRAAGGEGGSPTVQGFPEGSPGASGKAYGGAVGADRLSIVDTKFENNLAGDDNAETVQSAGGAIGAGNFLEISNSTFLNNQAIASTQAFGGAVLSASSTSIQNVLFESNGVLLDGDGGYGGAVYAPPTKSDNSSIQILTVTMLSNFAGVGGAVFINNTEQVLIQDGDIEGNSATYGGGIYLFAEENLLQGSQEVNIQSMSFENNFATFGGGALFVSNDTLSQVNTTQFDYDNNTALYGSATASDVTQLSFAYDPPNSVWPGEVFSMELVLLDGLNNTVINPNLTVTVKSVSSTFISGVSQDTALINMANGHFVFAASTLVSNTGSQCQLNFTSVSPSSLDTVSTFFTNLTLLVTECPPSTTLSVSSFGYTCDACQPDEYNLDGDKCHKCPKAPGATTDDNSPCVDLDVQGRQLIVQEGFYPDPSYKNPSKLLACRYSKACKQFTCTVSANGTNLDVECNKEENEISDTSSSSSNTCSDGYENRMCSKCVCNSDECYYLTSENSCLQCESSHRDQWIENQLYLVNGIFVAGVVYMLVTKAIPSALIRGFWFYIQSTLTLLVPQAWPKWTYQIAGYLPFVSSLQIYSAQCLLPPSWANPIPQFLIAMIMPFLLTGAAIIGFLSLKFFRWLDKKLGIREKVLNKVTCITCLLPQKPPSSSSPKHKKSLGYYALRSLLLVLNLTYFTLAVSILMVLQPCDSDNYMPQYPWISCHSAQYHTLISLGTAFALFYILGVPALFGILLFIHRQEIRTLKMTKESLSNLNSRAADDFDFENVVTQPLLDFGGTAKVTAPRVQGLQLIEFLFQSYTMDAYWFEIIWISRKLAIAIALHLIPSVLGQVTCITLVLALGIAIQNWLQPYEKEFSYINTIEIVSCGVIAFTLDIGYHIKEYGSGVTKETVQTVLLFINALMTLGILGVMIFQLIQFRKGKRQRTLANASFRWMMTDSQDS